MNDEFILPDNDNGDDDEFLLGPDDSNVVHIPLVTRLDIPPERVLRAALRDALAGKLTGVVVVGEFEDGSELFASSWGGGPDVVWTLERAKHKLMLLVDEAEDD